MEKEFEFHGYIYITLNQQENKCYIGQKAFPPNKTKSYLGSGIYFTRAVKKYGKKFFKKIILGEIFSNDIEDFKKQLNEAETECIYFFRAYGTDGEHYDEIYGYNLVKEGGSPLGYKHTEEACKKISETHTNRIFSLEHRTNLSLSSKDKPKSPEHKISIGLSSKNRKPSEETKSKIGKGNTGKTLSEETKNNLSITRTGKGNPSYVDVDIDKIISLKNEGKKLSEIAKILNVNVGIIRRRLENPDKYR